MKQVHRDIFIDNLKFARFTNRMVELNTSTPKEVVENGDIGDVYFLADHISTNGLITPNCMGFCIRGTGELVALFSTKKGFGDYLVRTAIRKGARHLNCFDGYLVKFYKRNGFVVMKREPNWTKGEPDVVYMVV